jgi:hypothetical protein
MKLCYKGDIATCSAQTLRLWSINGDLIVAKTLSNIPGPIMCCTFYEVNAICQCILA